MNIFTIVGVAIIGVVLSLIIANYNKEYSMLIALCCGVIIFGMILYGISPIITLINTFANDYGINNVYIKIILKALSIAYITQLCINICNDSGQSAIAGKVELAGKVIILILAIPLFEQLLKISTDLIMG